MIDGQYKTEVMEADADEFLVDVPAAVMEELGIQAGDEVIWTIYDDGRVLLTKAAN